jgi:hypothetical protein
MAVSLARVKGPKSPMKEVPSRNFVDKGYGLIQVPHHEWADRIAAVQVVRNLIQSQKLPADSEPVQQCLSLVKGMFSRIYVGDCYDWYTTSRFLGHPSGAISKVLSTQLAIMKGALREQSVEHFNSAIGRFSGEHGLEMLENYLDMTLRAAHPVMEEGWAYVLWSSSERDVVHMGAAGGEVEDVIKRLNAENPENHPYGVLAAWLVHDPVDAYNHIHKAFDGNAMGDGFFRVDFATARNRINDLLKESDNFALSPWHDYDPEIEVQSTVAPRKAVGM